MMHEKNHDPSMCWSQVPVHLEAASLEGFGDCFHCPVWSGRHGPQCGMIRFSMIVDSLHVPMYASLCVATAPSF